MSATLEDIKKTFVFAIPADVLAKLDPAKPLISQGVDSLAMTAMAVALQNAFKVKISVEDGLKLKTLNDVLAFVNKAR
jgi:acyl carrier protein